MIRATCFLCIIGVLGRAQTGCPAIHFQSAAFASLVPTASSHLTLVRQGDGSLTGYEQGNTSPYAAIHSTPNYQMSFAPCQPRSAPRSPAKPPVANFGNPTGASIQLQAFALLASGHFLSASLTNSGIDVAEFDQNLKLISESQFNLSAGGILFADVNGDGIPDLVTIASGAPTGPGEAPEYVAVLLGNGGTSFQSAIEHPIAEANGFSQISTIAMGDFNGDHKPDVVVGWGFGNDGGISILLGNGDGTFGAEQVVLNLDPQGIVVADLNGDGHDDLVFTTRQEDGLLLVINVALGSGSGTFAQPVSYPAGSDQFADVAVGDVDGDGNLDIVGGGGVSILFGDGKGNFPRRRDYVASVSPVILMDFDGDGILDIVGAEGNPYILGGSSVTVLFGKGAGEFVAPPTGFVLPTSASDAEGTAIASADFNHDGNIDIAAADRAGRITILKGNGDGTFIPGYQFDAAQSIGGVVTALISTDLNHDGIPDLAGVLDRGPDPAVLLVMLGNGDGTFQTPVTFPAGQGATNLAAADFNRDGNQDLAVVVSSRYGGAADQVLIYLGNGHGGFSQANPVPAGVGAFGVAAADFNQDGKQDLAVSNLSGSVSVFLGNGDGTFSAAQNTPLPVISGLGPYVLIAADFNRDGKPDLAVTLSGDDKGPAGLAVLLGRGDGTFQSPSIYAVTSNGVATADLDGDGIPDLIACMAEVLFGSPGIGYLLGNGDGTFQPEVRLDPALVLTGDIGPVVTGDFNHDGRIDIAGLSPAYTMEILLNLAQGPPGVSIVSAASLSGGPIAPGSIASAFGTSLAPMTATAASDASLPTTLGGISVSVTDAAGVTRPAALYYASPHQVNFVVPDDAATGAATVTLTSTGATIAVPVQIAVVAPALFTLNAMGLAAAYVVRVSNGTQTIEPVYATQGGFIVPAPIDLSSSTDQSYLVLFGTGIRGAPATVSYDNDPRQQVSYSGAQPGTPGLDQVNVLLPQGLSTPVIITVTAGGIISNAVSIQRR